jgi:hypothetical protein
MGRYISTIGTATAATVEVSTTYTASVSDRILADSSGGVFTITLPPNADLLVGDIVQILDVTGNFSANNVTVGRNSSKIQSATEDLTLDVANVALTLIYTGSTYGWVIASS